jgi:hypothetical protein
LRADLCTTQERKVENRHYKSGFVVATSTFGVK